MPKGALSNCAMGAILHILHRYATVAMPTYDPILIKIYLIFDNGKLNESSAQTAEHVSNKPSPGKLIFSILSFLLIFK